MIRFRFSAPIASLLCLVALTTSSKAIGQDATADADRFMRDVWPIFQARCIECHGPDKQRAKLRLDSPDDILKGSEDGPILVAGKPAESSLYSRITLPADHDDIMPPKGDPLTPEQIAAIGKWIETGATFGTWTGASSPAAATPSPAPAEAAVAEKPATEKAAVAPADSGVALAEATKPEEKVDPLDELSKAVAPPSPDALAAITAFGAIALPISKDSTLVRVDFRPVKDTVTDEQLALLAPLAQQIVWLDLAGTKITDAGVEKVGALANLTSVHLEKTAIGDGALPHLKGLSHLEYLNLYGTKVSDAGLSNLAELKQLKRLYLWQSQATAAGADSLKAALPGLDINLGWQQSAAAPSAATAPATPPTTAPVFDKDSCCAKAQSAGKACDHPCCVEAAKAGQVCAKCNPESAKKAELSKLFDPGGCCAKAQGEGKACDHPCCVEAAASGKICAKCNPEGAKKADAAITPPPPAQPAPAAAPEPTPETTPKADPPAPVRGKSNKATPVSYNRDVRPIFAEHCLTCHGQDPNSRKASLRLDQRESALAHALVPGDSAASELIKRVAHTDPKEIMPPPSSGKPLKPEEVALLQQWIDEGAVYEVHWSYTKPVRHALPDSPADGWARNPIDNYIRAGMERHQLSPSPEADKTTLIRRLSFDLVGLPPTPAEVDAFVNDSAPDAYEKLVDRLLASPRYGERMAMDWLDVVRYADTNGFHGDEYRSVYPYRDYVIKAFNENMPYDQFTIEQVGGDLLPNATVEQKVAATYNRLNQLTAEGGAQAGEYLAKYAADRIRTTSTVWLGSTLGCAECHDHKFDPFTTKDFYSFGAFFADIQEQGVYGAGQRWDPVLMLPSEDQKTRLLALDNNIASLRKTLETPSADYAAGQAKWEDDLLATLASEENNWLVLSPSSATGANGTILTVEDDRALFASGENPAKEVYTVTYRTDQRNITGLRLEVFPDARFPNGGLGRGNGNIMLSGFEVETVTGGTSRSVAIARSEADYEQEKTSIAAVLDTDPETTWAVMGHKTPAKHHAVFTFAEPLAGGTGTFLTVRLRHESSTPQRAIGRFRLALTTAESPRIAVQARVPSDVFTALRIAPELRSDAEKSILARHYLTVAPELNPVREQLAAAQSAKAQLEKEIPFTLLTQAVEPRVTRVLPRGNWMDESGEVVQPAVPHFMTALNVEGRRATRLDLARWLVSPDNPLAPRVYMNRLWKNFFGTGLSKVLDDLGLRGEWPTHPELLDWLAVEFVESGWNVKHMVRLMVTSSTYRQGSVASPKAVEADPYNRYLAHQAQFRLPAELVRDNALAVSGLLVNRIGGPSVKPYQPDGYWADCNTFTGPLIYDTSTGENQYRRGLYTFWKRSFLHPSLLAFDAPSREECTADRSVSNTPLQALVLLNDPTYVEAARVFAERILREGGTAFEDRLTWAFARALSRKPLEAEAAVLKSLCSRHVEEFGSNPEAATRLVSAGQAPVAADLNPAELAGWTSVARAILNLHESNSRS